MSGNHGEKTRAENEILETLRASIRRNMNEIADHVDTGGCHNFEEYKHDTGRILGLALAERELLELDNFLLKQ